MGTLSVSLLSPNPEKLEFSNPKEPQCSGSWCVNHKAIQNSIANILVIPGSSELCTRGSVVDSHLCIRIFMLLLQDWSSGPLCVCKRLQKVANAPHHLSTAAMKNGHEMFLLNCHASKALLHYFCVRTWDFLRELTRRCASELLGKADALLLMASAPLPFCAT